MTTAEKLRELVAVLLTGLGLALPVGPGLILWEACHWPEAVYR